MEEMEATVVIQAVGKSMTHHSFGLILKEIGPKITFYFMELICDGLYPLVEFPTVHVQLRIKQLLPFVMQINTLKLKRVCVSYHKHCVKLEQETKQQKNKFKRPSVSHQQLEDIKCRQA